ncbi:hypothetical protein KBB08_01490 [Candidatus Gracilibacteria bacterium]|nr:hypothetical protein [Candidatus Gracilibacteria bacterium]
MRIPALLSMFLRRRSLAAKPLAVFVLPLIESLFGKDFLDNQLVRYTRAKLIIKRVIICLGVLVAVFAILLFVIMILLIKELWN